jgi:hypothetical protein
MHGSAKRLEASFRDDAITGVAELHAMFTGEDH